MPQSYYDILEVAKSATQDEIKKSYKKLAKKYHPDMHPNDKTVETKFKELSEAYAVLSNEEKRKQYDNVGHDAFTSSGQGYDFQNMNYDDMRNFNFGGTSFEDLFSDMFTGRSARGSRRQTYSEKGEDITYQIAVDLDDVINGSTFEITVAHTVKCKKCNGSGGKKIQCPACGGSGISRKSNSFFQTACPTCNGTGMKIVEACTECGGKGYNHLKERIKITIPKGVQSGARIRIQGKGNAGVDNAPSGDLYILTEVNKHSVYTREGNDLYLNLPLDIFEAMLGTKIAIPTPYGEINMTIPKGTNNGQKLRLKSKGMPVMKTENKGDLYVIINIVTPNISDETLMKKLENIQKIMPKLDRTSLLNNGKIKG